MIFLFASTIIEETFKLPNVKEILKISFIKFNLKASSMQKSESTRSSRKFAILLNANTSKFPNRLAKMCVPVDEKMWNFQTF